GERAPANDLAVGYFAQHQLEQLDPRRSALEHFFEIEPAAREMDLRRYLGGFGFSENTVLVPTKPFSGGEKSRLALALLVRRKPNLLLLDEPTNHLDLDMRRALCFALQEFAGAMVIVSHDRHLLRVTTDQLLLVHDGAVTEFDGSLDDYPAWLARQNRPGAAHQRSGSRREKAAERQTRKRREAVGRQSSKRLERRIEKAEAALARLNERKTELEGRLAQPELYQSDMKPELEAVLGEQTDNSWALAKAEAEWLEASEALEHHRETDTASASGAN
ncbi:MAG: ATP-binding cassette domain-containing protein, partial [Woeseia sp.]